MDLCTFGAQWHCVKFIYFQGSLSELSGNAISTDFEQFKSYGNSKLKSRLQDTPFVKTACFISYTKIYFKNQTYTSTNRKLLNMMENCMQF